MRPKAYTRRKELLWLNDLRWYFIQGLDPMVNIQDFFDAPHVQSSWKITRKNLNLVRFGLMWRIFDRSSSSSFLVGNSFSLTHFLITNFSSPGGLASLCKSFVLPNCWSGRSSCNISLWLFWILSLIEWILISRILLLSFSPPLPFFAFPLALTFFYSLWHPVSV